MILYFSATGNCQFAAKKIAQATNDIAVSMTELSGPVILKDQEPLGIITPTYFWGLPSYVEDFLNSLVIVNGESTYIYCVATYGTTTGQADYFADRYLRAKGLRLSASYGIKTVDNWTVLFSVEDKEEIRQTLEEEAAQLSDVIASIKRREQRFICKDKKSLFMCKGARFFYKKARATAHLHVNDQCIQCGICEKGCPVQAIRLVDGRPEWIQEHCVMCLKCLHSCPRFAIQYDDKTQNHGQYRHPDFQNDI